MGRGSQICHSFLKLTMSSLIIHRMLTPCHLGMKHLFYDLSDSQKIAFAAGWGFKRIFRGNIFPVFLENPFEWAVTASPGASAQ